MTFAGAIADRRRGILDGDFLAAPIEEHGVVGQPDDARLAQAAHHGILYRLTIVSLTSRKIAATGRPLASRVSQPVRLSATGLT